MLNSISNTCKFVPHASKHATYMIKIIFPSPFFMFLNLRNTLLIVGGQILAVDDVESSLRVEKYLVIYWVYLWTVIWYYNELW